MFKMRLIVGGYILLCSCILMLAFGVTVIDTSFIVVIAVITAAVIIQQTYMFGYEQCREAHDKIVVVHKASTETDKLKITEYDKDGALMSSHEYIKDSRWQSGYCPIISKE